VSDTSTIDADTQTVAEKTDPRRTAEFDEKHRVEQQHAREKEKVEREKSEQQRRRAAEDDARRRADAERKAQRGHESRDTPEAQTDTGRAGLANPLDDKASSVDLLGRAHLVTILKGIIDRDIKKHMTIALFGQWGSGKSSVIELLGQKYSGDRHCSLIQFNAWQNEHSQNMSASIAERMVDELYQRRGLLAQLWLGFKSQLLQSKFSLGIYALALMSVLALSLFGEQTRGLLSNVMSAPTVDKVIPSGRIMYLLTAVIAALPIIRKFINNPFVGRLRQLASRPDFSAHIGLNHTIRTQLNSLIRAWDFDTRQLLPLPRKRPAKPPHKFILAIDDLDRCSGDKIIQVLEAIQLVVDLDNVLVILAVDDRVLMEAVAAKYRKQNSKLSDAGALQLAREYLGKILQITISLDQPGAAQRQQFICGRLYPDIEKAPEKALRINSGKMADDDAAEFLFRAPASLGDGVQADDEPTAYLHSKAFERQLFSDCVGAFNIHNARTMIRIHNAITLLKGLRADVAENQQRLQQYIFLAFWLESLCAADPAQHSHYYQLLAGGGQSLPAYWQTIAQLAARLQIPKLKRDNRDRMLSHIAGISLP